MYVCVIYKYCQENSKIRKIFKRQKVTKGLLIIKKPEKSKRKEVIAKNFKIFPYIKPQVQTNKVEK